MAVKPHKEKTNKFLEVTDPKTAVGLWSYAVVRETAITPVGATKEALGRFLNGDIVRWEHRQEMCDALVARGVGPRGGKSAARAIGECLAQADADKRKLSVGAWRAKYAWLLAWSRYACRAHFPKAVAAEKDVQMFFNAPSAGLQCNEPNLHRGRTFFLRTKSAYFVAFVLKPGGTKWWLQIDQTNVTWTDQVYERLVIDPRGRLTWGPILADVINEQVAEKNICLFQLADDALFRAITDNGLNPDEKYAHLNTCFEFFCSPSASEFHLRWSVVFNPRMSRLGSVARAKPRIVEVMGERKKGWIARQRDVTDGGAASDEIARWVVENDGCAVLPAGASDELRLRLSHALFFVTFPDRRPDEIGGLLRGYQLPGRLVERAQGKIRWNGVKALVERTRRQSEDAVARRRKSVVDCLFDRTARVLAERNRDVFDAAGAAAQLEASGARTILERAAWARGFMEGNALTLFKPSPTAGILKLPDLSLALGFERRLGLKGATASAGGPLVQTAPIRSLAAARTVRDSMSGAYPCRALWTPKPGKDKELVSYMGNAVRWLRDDDRLYLMLVPKFATYWMARDLACAPDGQPLVAYSFKSANGARSRASVALVEETFDFNKVMKLAHDGRICLYALDFGQDRSLAERVFSPANASQCRAVASVPILVPTGADAKNRLSEKRKSGNDVRTWVPSDSATAEVRVTFVFNPAVARDGRKVDGRLWSAYCETFPDEARRRVVRWPDGARSLDAALAEVAATDGVLVTDKAHLEDALRAATFVGHEGYNLKDRVFFDAARKGAVNNLKKDRGKPLAEVLPPDALAAAEEEFVRQIESDRDVKVKVGPADRALVSREFRRVVFTGTMRWQQQLNRPAHEVALGLWLLLQT